MDLSWERSIPLVQADDALVDGLFREFCGHIVINSCFAVNTGCRNSNYVVDTSHGKYLLRMGYSNELNNEAIAYAALRNRIAMPSLLYHTEKCGLNAFIYEYVDGELLQKHILERNGCDFSLLQQVARAAALIHNTSREEIAGVKELDTPPFHLWYEYFIENPNTKGRLGSGLYDRLYRLLSGVQHMLDEIDRYYSVIHADFRPANMMVDKYNTVYILDWEYLNFGHTLADIGQFFRYRQFFNQEALLIFEKAYNESANHALPQNWVELSAIRDLVNPLQMLSSENDQPVKHLDLLNTINATVAFFGY